MQRDIRTLLRQPVVPPEAGLTPDMVGNPGGFQPGGGPPGDLGAAGREDPLRDSQGATLAGRGSERPAAVRRSGAGRCGG